MVPRESWLVVAVLVATVAAYVPPGRPCVAEDYDLENGGRSSVCVCNATHCDDMADLGELYRGKLVMFTTTQAGLRFERSKVFFAPYSDMENRPERIRLTINPDDARQEMKGFGGAFTDSATITMSDLPAAAKNELIEAYFGDKGIRYTIGRVPIASADFSTREYSYVDQANDFNLTTFTLAEEDTQYKIPVIQQALRLAPQMQLFASPWSAPAWMKTNTHMKGAGTLIERIDGVDVWQVWADYFVKFFHAYNDVGIPFWGVTPQNEPNVSSDPNYQWQATYYTPSQLARFVRDYLTPTLKKDTLTKDIDVMLLDHNRDELDEYVNEQLIESRLAAAVDGIALHWYADDKTDPAELSKTHGLFPDKYMLYTEACEGWVLNDVRLGSWERAMNYTTSILDAVNNWVTGWVDWNLCLDMTGGPNWVANNVDAPIIIDKSKGEFYKQPMFYAMGHFSRFVRPGAKYVTSAMSPTNGALHWAAFVNADESRVVVVHNKGNSPLNLTLMEKGAEFDMADVRLQPRSITTLIWSRSEEDPRKSGGQASLLAALAALLLAYVI